MSKARSAYDDAAVAGADEVVQSAIDGFLKCTGEKRAIVVTAPAGAGKSTLICRAVGAASKRKKKLRVAIVSPTNEQALGLADRLASEHPRETISLLPRDGLEIPESLTSRRNFEVVTAARANKASVVVGTLAKLGDAFGRNQLHRFDAMMIDESYQANSTQYYAIGHLAPTHLLVGDGGQLSPFSTLKDADHWRGLAEDPLQTAVGVLLRNHRDATPVHKLPITRRLDARAVPIAQAFYPGLTFQAAVRTGVRKLELTASSKAGRLDRALDAAAERGWAHLVLPEALTLSADPEMIASIVGLVTRLRARKASVRCERSPNKSPPRVAVGVSHNDQKDQLRAALQSARHDDVIVDTANRLQGLEFDVVIAWHPLAGLPEADEFHLDPGRLCVLLTRHRHACIVVGRDGDRELVRGVPPKSPAYVGWDQDPLLDGWAVHEELFQVLAAHRID